MTVRDEAAATELERLRLENEALSGVVGVVASGPDLAHILDRVVDLLTKATSSHACFVYLRSGERLVMRAAPPVYSHLVGRISFGADEGLAGWAMREGQSTFIREGALEDPRNFYVPELEEERFQSMAAIPISSRAGEAIGAIVLHTVAPREFDEGIVNVLSRSASLISGAIENARLYDEARERVEELTRLSNLGREIAAVSDRQQLFEVAATGIRALVGADVCRVYETGAGEPRRLASSPAEPRPSDADEAAVLAALLAERALPVGAGAALGVAEPVAAALALPLSSGEEQRIGAIVVAAAEPWPSAGAELLRAAVHQVNLALEKISLIERLTEENVAPDLFDAIAEGDLEVAGGRAEAAGIELRGPHLAAVAVARAPLPERSWRQRGEALERAIRRLGPGAVCDVGPEAVRALLPARAGEKTARWEAALAEVCERENLSLGLGEVRAGLEGARRSLGEAGDAARVGASLLERGGVTAYRDTGAYRYLIDLLDSGGPEDHLRELVDRLATYDRERSAQLLATLDAYLDQGRSVTATARQLWIHVNTLRQRLERIEALTGVDLAEEDLLALQLAVKLALVRGRGS
ncbi:MAG TPA: helix-turn-helix domain-containing protein [Solirubrobacterales bacterium]|nr:helix-turn-helix domain-containing protein [Solirubrobacterales bacterium]